MEEIVIEGKDLYTEIQEYFLTEFPEKVKLLRLYENPDFPLCKLYSTVNRIGKGVERVCMVEKRRISYYPANGSFDSH